jgi:outer membrane cobalamin receptor
MFKAPSPDQLYDQRSIPIPVPPFSVTTSNADLAPQRGSTREVGLYHAATLSSSSVATGSVSAYQMDMRDELDFDVATLRYVNIGRSRHRGVEVHARITETLGSSVFTSYTLQDVTAQAGANTGKRLKAIPRHTLTGGATSVSGAWRTTILTTHARGVYLDDANTVTLPDFTRIDLRFEYLSENSTIFVDIRNARGARYASTGFLDPSGSGAVYVYPAARRVVDIGVRSVR